MGLLTEGHPLSWEETKALADHVRKHGIIQFVNLYHRLKNRKDDILKFGDEVEYIIVKFNHEEKTARVKLSGPDLIEQLNQKEMTDPNVASLWRKEYAAYMMEGTPGKPYGGSPCEFRLVEENMKQRRREVQEMLQEDEYLMTVTSFPRLGCKGFTWPIHEPTPAKGVTRSLFFPDQAICSHPRFPTLTRNVRCRRGEKAFINIPIFRDKNTPDSFVEDLCALGDTGEAAKVALPNHVYLDATGFGMGCCCLQVTFQACCIEEARILYDQLAGVCPIMLSLTAASPIFRGYLTEIDCRWSVISNVIDCRTREERGLEPLKNDKFCIPKSRYDTIDSYLSEYGEKLNDVPLIYDESIYNQLRGDGIDHLLAQHVAHLFIRDTISLFSEKVDQDDENDSDHFENIQSTNWQSMRFKPPPPDSNIGWRVEFRPCEVQFTDFENAAVISFIVLLTRVILSYKLNLVIPISKVQENMKNAQKMNSITSEKFWFRKNINLSGCVCSEFKKKFADMCTSDDSSPSSAPVCILMTVNEIINGKEGEFPGLAPLLGTYLSSIELDAETHCVMHRYLDFIKRKAAGDILTTASWMRKFVHNHPAYKHDSVVTDEINYDLLRTVQQLQEGKQSCPELFGEFIIPPTTETTANSSDSIVEGYENYVSNENA